MSASSTAPCLVERPWDARRDLLGPLDSDRPPLWRMNPRNVVVLNLPPVIGNVNVAPDPVAGASGATVM